MKSLDEIIVEARQHCEEVDLYEEGRGATKLRPETSSGPRARAFCKYVLSECKANGIELPEGIKDKETFFEELNEKSIEKYYNERGYKTYSTLQKQQLIGFIDTLAGSNDERSKNLVELFTASKEFSETDKEFLYSSYLVREMVVKSKTSQEKVNKLNYLNGQTPEEFAKSILNEQLEETRRLVGENFPIPEEEKERRVSMVIGVPGAGKSSCINKLKVQDSHVHIDLDAIATKIAAQAGNLSIADNSEVIYGEANKIAEIVAKNALKQGYNIAVEKIGFSRDDIVNTAKHYMSMISDLGFEPKAGLHCVHVSKECSTVRASQRTVGQMMDGKPLRYYPETEVITKNNVAAFAYLETLQAQVMGNEKDQIFDKFELTINEGLSKEDKEIPAVSMGRETLEEKRNKHKEEEQNKAATQKSEQEIKQKSGTSDEKSSV